MKFSKEDYNLIVECLCRNQGHKLVCDYLVRMGVVAKKTKVFESAVWKVLGQMEEMLEEMEFEE